MPSHGGVCSFKDPFDTKDIRTTAGGDAAYDIDVPARDHILVERLREKGAIIFAKAVCTEYNGRAGHAFAPLRPPRPGPPAADRPRVPPSRSAPISSCAAWAKRPAPRPEARP